MAALREGCIIHSEHRAARALTLPGITFLTLCFSPIANIAPVARLLAWNPSVLLEQRASRFLLSMTIEKRPLLLSLPCSRRETVVRK